MLAMIRKHLKVCFLPLCFVVFLLLIRFVVYPNDWQTSFMRGGLPDSIATEPDLRVDSTDRKSHDATFIYSTKGLFQTVLDIRRKNCQLVASGDDSECQDIERCNNVSHRVSDDSPTCQKRLPRCLVIGEEKAGTREVLDFLMMHPMIMVKTEPYFGTYFNNRSYNRGIDWYRSEMPYTLETQITIEKGVYFDDPVVPARIHGMDPDIKMILMIRDPVDRVISWLSFLTSVEETKVILKKHRHNLTSMGTVRKSMYDESYRRYLQYFKRSQIHIVDFERFKRAPFKVLRGIETYLGLQHAIQEEDLVFNEDKGFFCARNVGQMDSVCFGEDRGRRNNGAEFDKYKPQLRRVFKQSKEQFFELVGREFNWS